MKNLDWVELVLIKQGFYLFKKKHGPELLANTFTNTLTNNQLADLIEEVTNDMRSEKGNKYKKYRLTLIELMHYISKNPDREKYAPLIQPYCIDFMRSDSTRNSSFNTNVWFKYKSKIEYFQTPGKKNIYITDNTLLEDLRRSNI